MQLRPVFAFTLLFAMMAGISVAKAEPKPLGLFWWPSHWETLTFKPYLEKPTQPQNTQWDEKTWVPADWTAQRAGGADELIQGFYTAGILNRQYVDNSVPVLEVGPNFYALSGYDKRRIARVVDDRYQITSARQNGMFTLSDWRTKKPIGLYSANGLQLQ